MNRLCEADKKKLARWQKAKHILSYVMLIFFCVLTLALACFTFQFIFEEKAQGIQKNITTFINTEEEYDPITKIIDSELTESQLTPSDS